MPNPPLQWSVTLTLYTVILNICFSYSSTSVTVLTWRTPTDHCSQHNKFPILNYSAVAFRSTRMTTKEAKFVLFLMRSFVILSVAELLVASYWLGQKAQNTPNRLLAECTVRLAEENNPLLQPILAFSWVYTRYRWHLMSQVIKKVAFLKL